MPTIKETMNKMLGHVHVDLDFVKKIEKFTIGFMAKNNDHVAFFGGTLLGVQAIRWNYTDSDFWWDELLDIVPEDLQRELCKTPEVQAHRKVSSDPLNQAMVYVMHLIESSKLPEDVKRSTNIRVMFCMNCKFLCSLVVRRFPRPADEAVAQKVFNCLANRFDLKAEGNWGKMITARSRGFTTPGSRYYKVLTEYNNDKEIVRMINDAQGRIRDTINLITSEHHRQLKNEARVLSTTSQVEIDGKIVLKDIQRKYTIYNRYIKTCISDGENFIKPPLNEVIRQAVPSLDPDTFYAIQETFVKFYHDKRYHKVFNNMVDDVLTFSFDLLKNSNIKENDLPGLIYRLKHVYMSGRVTDDAIHRARRGFEKVVEAYDKRLRNTPMIGERCGLFLYIVLRTLTMRYYK